jgi:hypothetical protein
MGQQFSVILLKLDLFLQTMLYFGPKAKNYYDRKSFFLSGFWNIQFHCHQNDLTNSRNRN